MPRPAPGADRRLAGGLGALVFGRAIGVGAEGAHMHDAPHPASRAAATRRVGSSTWARAKAGP